MPAGFGQLIMMMMTLKKLNKIIGKVLIGSYHAMSIIQVLTEPIVAGRLYGGMMERVADEVTTIKCPILIVMALLGN